MISVQHYFLPHRQACKLLSLLYYRRSRFFVRFRVYGSLLVILVRLMYNSMKRIALRYCEYLYCLRPILNLTRYLQGYS